MPSTPRKSKQNYKARISLQNTPKRKKKRDNKKNQAKSITHTSHNRAAIGVLIAKHGYGAGFLLVMPIFQLAIISMLVVVVVRGRSCIRHMMYGFYSMVLVLLLLQQIRAVMGRKGPQLRPPPRLPHRLQYLLLIGVSCDDHFLHPHVYIYLIHPCKYCKSKCNITLLVQTSNWVFQFAREEVTWVLSLMSC